MSTKLPEGYEVISTNHEFEMDSSFRPGVYRHYKGGLYYAMTLAWANEVSDPRELVVVYLSLTTGAWHTRPYSSSTYDAWTDRVQIRSPERPQVYSVRRFQFVGPQPIPA